MPRTFRSIASAVLLAALLSSFTPGLLAADTPYVPEALTPWVDWVLDDGDQRDCPLGSAGDGERVCAWPGRLWLDIDDQGGRFEQRWTLQAEAWIPLPGGGAQWPQQVGVGEDALAVVERDGRPVVHLQPGDIGCAGGSSGRAGPRCWRCRTRSACCRYGWTVLEQTNPRLDTNGRLWLGAGDRPLDAAEPDTLTLEVARRIDDAVPLRVHTRLSLDVSGPDARSVAGAGAARRWHPVADRQPTAGAIRGGR